MGFCIICFRQDRRVRFIDNLLTEFHDELCDFGIPSSDNHYCSECEHLLSKFFKFRKQCVIALKLYVKWKAKKCSSRPPISELQKQLGPPTLSHWNPSSKISHIFINSDMDSKPFVDQDNGVFQFEHCYTVPDSDYSQDEQVEVKLEAKERTDDALILDIKQEKHDPSDITENLQDFTIEEHDAEVPTITIKEIPKPTTIKENKKIKKMKIKTNVKKIVKEKAEERDDNEYFDDEFFDSLTQISLGKDSDADLDDNDEDYTPNLDEEIKPNADTSRADYCDYANTKNKIMIIQKMKEAVIQKVSTYDNIAANDGTPMDKDMLIEGIRQHKLARETLARMQRALRAKGGMSSKARELLAMVYKTAQEDVMYGEVFDIQYLHTIKLKKEEFKNRKNYVAYIKSKYQCDICFLPFINNKTKELHIKECHDETKESVVCPFCDVRLNKDPVRIRRHNLNHDVVYKCKMCPTITYDRGTMKLHYNRHKGKDFRCDACNTTYKSMSGYYLHMSVYHNKVKHICTTCGRGFSTFGALKTHIGSKTHPINPTKSEDPSESVRCEACDVTLPSRAVYDAHVGFVHATHTRAPDDVQRITRVYRARKKASQRQYVLIKCRLCNKSNRGGGWLKWHFHKEHPTENWAEVYPEYNKHLCDVCGASFKNIFHLRTHMNIHTGALPFSCNICHKKFRSTILLKSHTSRHFAPSHLCYQCGKKFHTRSNLIRHYKCHTGEKANKCEICGKSFFAASNLREHVQSVHHHIRKVRNRKETSRKIIQEITAPEME